MKRMLILAIAFPSITNAAPVYLDCFISLDGNPFKFNVTADESSGKITHTNNDGSIFKTDGAFTVSTVTYKKIDFFVSGKVKSEMIFEINRETLGIVRNHIIGLVVEDPENPPKLAISNGSCTVQEVKSRKF